MLEVALDRISEAVPRERIVLLCMGARGAARAYGVAAVAMPARTPTKWRTRRWRRPIQTALQWRRLARAVDACDVLVVSGGGNMNSLFGAHLETRLMLVERARRLGKPVVLVSQTLGPFEPAHRDEVRAALAGADWVGVRDRGSVEELGPAARLAPDDAVFLAPAHVPATVALAARRGRLLGLSLHGIPGMTDARLGDAADAAGAIAGAAGWKTVLVPHQARRGEGDLLLARRVRERLGAEACEVLPVLPARAVRALAGDLALAVSTRYHGVVFALAAGTPAVALASSPYTERKMVGAFETFGLPPSVVALERVAADLPAAAARAVAARDAFARAAAAMQGRLDESLAPYRRVAALLDAPPR
jgi:polysaccharide pyruvyl transferase WcaK-like protein